MNDIRAEHLQNIAPRVCALMRKHIAAEQARKVDGSKLTQAMMFHQINELCDLALEIESAYTMLKESK